MGLRELREQLLVDSKLMEVSIGTFVRKFLVLLMRECKLQWSDIKDLNQKLTEKLRNFKEQQQGPANDQNIIEIIDVDNAPEDEAAYQEKNMNTDEKEANDKPKESGSEEQKNEMSHQK